MNSKDPKMARVRELSQRVADGIADEDAVAELDGLLAGDKLARRSYLEMMDLHFDLERKAARGTLAADQVSDGGAEVISYESDSHRAGWNKYTRPVIVVAASVALLLAINWWMIRPADPVATIVKAAGEKWSKRSSGDLIIREGQDFALESGLVELETKRGVRLVLESPFEGRFEDGGGQLSLRTGKLYAEVPEAGQGFTVTTPAGRVVDLGTRFGVEVTDGDTEVHVLEGRVVAEAGDGSSNQETELVTGHAVRFKKSAQAFELLEFDGDKFTQIVGTFYDPFEDDGRIRPVAGRNGWFEPGAIEGRARIQLIHRGMSYPDLAQADADSLEIRSKGMGITPVGHHFPFSFSSAILRMDDDLLKNLRHESDIDQVVLLAFDSGSLAKTDRVQLVVKAEPNSRGRHCRLGLMAGDTSVFSPDSYHATQVFFVVVQIDGQSAHLWINPDSEFFGEGEAPPPLVTLKLPKSIATKMILVGHEENPKYTHWWLDELRGGHSWSDVTPPIR